MKRNRLYTTVIDKADPERRKITVKPSKYLKKLHPEDVIAELEAYIQGLKDELIRYSQKDLCVAKNRNGFVINSREIGIHFVPVLESQSLKTAVLCEANPAW